MVKISNNFRDENSMCYLPPSLHIEVESPNLKLTTAIDLVKRDVIAPVSRHVRSIRKGVDGTLKIEHHSTDEKEVSLWVSYYSVKSFQVFSRS